MTKSIISVIIPVYNTAKFIQKAVESAVSQPETGEIILVDDGSTDYSVAICQQLCLQFDNVFLFRHEGNVNRGISATRNLGIQNSKCPLIAFLDSDDYYLPDAFTTAVRILEDPTIDGVYGIVKDAFLNADQTEVPHDDVFIGIKEYVASDDLFAVLVNGRLKSFHPNSLVVRRTLLEKTGLFDEKLILKEDVELFTRMAAMGSLVPGDFGHPVAIHTMHVDRSMNRMAKVLPVMNKKFRMGLLKWVKKRLPEDRKKIELLEIRVAAEYLGNIKVFCLFRPFYVPFLLLFLVLHHPGFFINPEVWKIMLKASNPSTQNK